MVHMCISSLRPGSSCQCSLDDFSALACLARIVRSSDTSDRLYIPHVSLACRDKAVNLVMVGLTNAQLTFPYSPVEGVYLVLAQ